MSINEGENGHRSVQAEVELPGSPEEVWQAIATGPGISSWFVPTVMEEHVGGLATSDFGMGMESESKITHWDPPRSFIKEGEGMGPDSPPVATEWTVEAKSGGTCIVRVVHSWFASSDEWDSQWDSVAKGWATFFHILRLALQHFPGQPSSAFFEGGVVAGSDAEVWAKLTARLGLTGATTGQEVRSGPGHPALSGRVEMGSGSEVNEILLLTTEPAPGACHLLAMPMGDQTYLSVRFYLFGATAATAVEQAQPEWHRWLAEHFPATPTP